MDNLGHTENGRQRPDQYKAVDTQDGLVCEICGSGKEHHIMANCAHCNAYQHCYCLPVVTYDIPAEWYCDECQNKANGDPKHRQGDQTFQRPLHGSDLMMARKTPMLGDNDKNMVHQRGHKTLKYKNTKVKSISFEEAASLSKDRGQHRRSNVTARRTYNQVHPASPPKVKQLPSMKCKSPSRSETQAPALKRCAAASQNPTKIENINLKPTAQSGGTNRADKAGIGSQIKDEPREKKLFSADKGKISSQIQDETRKKNELNASGSDTGFEFGTENLHHETDILVVINSSVQYIRRPPPPICWTGCFRIFDGKNSNTGEYQAYFPAKVSPEVYDFVKKMPNDIKLEILPRINDWPKSFETSCPVYEDIGLFFFSNELDCHEKKHPPLMETYCNFVMRAQIDNIKLLIYSSELLPPDSQWIDGEIYLWGVFLKPKGKGNPARCSSLITI